MKVICLIVPQCKPATLSIVLPTGGAVAKQVFRMQVKGKSVFESWRKNVEKPFIDAAR